MAEQIPVKAYLRNGPEPEIRKTMIDADVATSFLYLAEKLKSMFPQIGRKHFSIQWEDDSNDCITISTDEELQLAITEMKLYTPKYYKFYIKLHDNEKKESSSPQMEKKVSFDLEANPLFMRTIHPHVICDVCSNSICGFRYKCIECDDYDLCSECEAKGHHLEHCMLRISHPVTFTPSMRHIVRKFSRKIEYVMQKENFGQSHQARKCRPFNDCPYKKDTSQSEKHTKCMSDPRTTTKSNAKGDRDNNVPRAQTQESDTYYPPDSTEQTTQKDRPLCLEDVFGLFLPDNSYGKVLSTILDKLVERPQESQAGTSTAENKSQEPKGGTESKRQEVPSESPPKMSQAPKESDEIKKPDDEAKTLSSQNTDQVPSTEPTPNTNQSIETQQTNEPKSCENNEKSEITDEWTIIDQNESSPNRTRNPSPAKEVIADTQIDKSESQPSAPPQKSLYPNLSEGHGIYHTDPVIQSAVETMISMGYSNTGGVLTYLLNAENGNIAKVLDLLEPVNR